MIPEFQYLQPKQFQEALEAEAKYGKGKAVYIAGGTDVLVRMRQSPETAPKVLVSLKKINKLKKVSQGKDTLSIGSLATLRDLENNKLIKHRFSRSLIS